MSSFAEYHNKRNKTKINLDNNIIDINIEDEKEEESPFMKYHNERKKQEYEKKLRKKEYDDEEDTDSWFKKGAFDDGYQFGDLTKTVGSTVGDAAVGLGKGIFRLGEGVGDLISYGVADIQEWTGNEEAAEATRERTRQSVTDEIFQPAEDFVDKNSVLGDKSDSITEGLGYVAGITAISVVSGGAGSALGVSSSAAATVGSTAATFTSAMGSGMSEALNDGATIDEARIYGAISGAGEAASELLFGGLGKASGALGLSKGVGELDDIIIGGMTKNIKNKMVKTVMQSGLKATEEGLEEIVSGLISSAGKKLTYMDEKEYSEIVKDENLAEQFWMGCLTSAIAQGPSAIKSVKSGTDYITGRTSNEQQIFDSLKENKTTEVKTQKAIDNMINEQQIRLKELYGRELTTEEVDKIKNTVSELNESGKLDIENTSLNKKEQARIEKEIENDLAEGNLSLETIRDILGENVDLSKDNLLQKSLYEDSQRYEDYKVELTGNEKVDKFLQSAAEAGVNNTTKTRKRIELISKLVENTDRNYRFVNQEQLKENGYNENANGLNENGYILLNVNSNKEIVAVVGHETTHLFDSKVDGEYTQEYKDLQTAVKNYLQANGTYEAKINEIMDTYNKAGINLSQEQIMEEVTADTIGDNLFGDNAEEFIKHLTTNRTVFQKIYDYIKKAVVNIKGYKSEEAKQLQNLKNAFDRVYKTLDTTGVSTETKYALSKNAKSDVYNVINETREQAEKNPAQFVKLKDNTIKSLVDYGIEDYPMMARRGHIRENVLTSQEAEKLGYSIKKKHFHGIGADTYLKIIDSMDSPIGVYQYTEKGNYDKNNFIVLTSVKLNGNNAIVPVEIKQRGQLNNVEIDLNRIKTVYSKDNNNYIDNMLKEGKIKEIFNGSNSHQTSLNNSIPSTNEDVNTTTKYSIQNNENNTQDNQGRTLSKEQQERYKDISTKLRDENGNIKRYYHGTQRGDRVGNVFDPKKATSGPMAFFTDNADVAKSYSENKQDTSLSREYDTEWDLFKANDKDLDSYWRSLSYEKRKEMRERGYNVGFNDDYELEFKENASKNSFGSHYANELSRNGNNPIKALYDTFINGGFWLGEDISNFQKVLDYIGVENTQYLDPYKTDNKVYEVYLNIKNPFDTSNISKEMLNKLEESAKNAKYNAEEAYSADMWDKTNIEPSEWIEYLKDDIKEGTTHSWTRIPDWVTDVLKSEGYDGIVDTGGKHGGQSHQVAIPFYSEQIKNIDNINPTDNPDIRYSMTEGETDQYWKKLDKSDLEEYNTIESEVGNNGEQQIRSENDRLQEKPVEELAAGNTEVYERIKELNRNIKREVAGERARLKDLVSEQLSELPISKTKTEKFVRELANNKVMTQEDIRNFIESNNKYIEKDINEYLQSIRKDISSYSFKLNDGIKSELRYTYDKIPRNIKLRNDGLSVDQVYQELSSKYPDIFSSEIINEVDQATEIIDFMRDVNPISTNETTIFNDEEINEASMLIYAYKQNYDEAKNYYGQYFLDEKKKIQDLSPKNIQENNTPKKLTRKMVREQILQEMNIKDSDLQAGKDISSINFQLSDPIRVNEKVFGREIGQKINDLTINQTKHHTAEKIRWQNKERAEIKDLGIKARSKESAAVQKYGEKQYVDKNGNIREYGEVQLAHDFPNVKTQEKIKNAARVIRGKYDTYIEQINDVLTALGYDAIPKRQDYMRHFQELGDIFSKTGVPFNLNDMSAENLPTDINGLTEFNRPGKNWFAQAQKRYGEKTSYDAITGIDGYLEGAGNLIFHTQDIQNYRAVSSLIRDTFGATKGFDKLEGLSDAEAQQRIADIQDNKLSRYVAWLDEQANNLAGKKGAIDRGVERFLGRKAYTFFNTIKKQVGSNMTGLNVRSSLTNLISSTIAAGKTNKISLAKGTMSTINNMLHNDGFIDKSDFLTSRFGSDTLSNKLWQKVSNAGQIFMNGTDYFTANIITRSKYYEGLQKGMTETEAIKYADDFASRVMGDRSQGATAEAFNSKTLGLFTQFQLEVNNQWQYMIHDTKMDYQKNSEINGGLKAGATALFQLGQIAAYSYFFNELFEKATGSRAAFDPIEIFKTLFGLDDDDEDKSFDERLSKAGETLVDNIPFGNLITGGGRIPISEAFTGLSTLGKKLTNQKDKYGGEITWEDVGKDTLKALPYWVLPTGYSQINKTSKGLGMYNDNLPVSGSYTDSGNLRYTVEDSVGSKIQAGLFGAYANPYAQDYIDSGFKTIDKKNIDEMVGLNMNSTEYRKFKEGLSKAGDKKEDKLNYINSSDLTSSQKNLVANNLNKNSKTKIDMEDYSGYDSYEEYEYATKNPQKYNVITQIDTYDNYNTYKKDIEGIKEAYSSAEGYSTAQRKAAVQSYIEGLDLNMYQKMMLEKMAGGYSIKKYQNYIYEYLETTGLSESEKYTIWEELFE